MIVSISDIFLGNASTSPVLDHTKITGRKSLPFNVVEGKEVSEADLTRYTNLVHKMIATCLREDGIGLALPQLGIFNGQLFVILDPNNQNTAEAYFNPTYRYDNTKTTKESKEEGCLSVRKTTKQLFSISRPSSIEASWYSLDTNTKTFIKREETLTGLRARVFMHEYDHLQGISIVEKYNQQQQQNKRKKNIVKE